MNIKEAKETIKNSVKLYLKRDEQGKLRIPVSGQRPIFLSGTPGIGKTEIVAQIAKELEIGFVSYSMTHHTRQSALGLPYIEHQSFLGKEYAVTEYTMSELIASVYETMEESGVREGILFLDEINCVSETLAPVMLQFLQYKKFGRYSLPEGWVVVTAGNPPEYNRSVRKFDVATLDRIKVMHVEADYAVWRDYAAAQAVNPVVLAFLDYKKEYFYQLASAIDGPVYVTARGWWDLAKMIDLYEESGLAVDKTLVAQYLQHEEIVREFCEFYLLYTKYKVKYHVEALLDTDLTQEMTDTITQAPVDERLLLLHILIEGLKKRMQRDWEKSECLLEEKKLLTEDAQACKHLPEQEAAYTEKVAQLQETVGETKKQLQRLFSLTEKINADGNELMILMTELTVDAGCAAFIGRFGSEAYEKHNERLLVSTRQLELQRKIAALSLAKQEDI